MKKKKSKKLFEEKKSQFVSGNVHEVEVANIPELEVNKNERVGTVGYLLHSLKYGHRLPSLFFFYSSKYPRLHQTLILFLSQFLVMMFTGAFFNPGGVRTRFLI